MKTKRNTVTLIVALFLAACSSQKNNTSDTDPVSTDPTSTDPTSTDPVSTDPVSTDPVSTDPTSTDSSSDKWSEALPGYGEDDIDFKNDGPEGASDGDTDTDSDIDTDTDSDSDTDTDTDTDADADSDVDADTDTDKDSDTELLPDGGIKDAGDDTDAPKLAATILQSIVEITENPFYTASVMPTNTFSIDVDTASYTLARQALVNGILPTPTSVRVEEMINYFTYNYEAPTGDNPFTVYTEMGECPWNPNRKLVMIGLRGQQLEMDDQPAANLVYLIDVSGSMSEEISLIKEAFRMLTEQLRPQDTLSIVTYAGNEAVVLDGGDGNDKTTILAAIDNLQSGGSTNGSGGIQKAYELATKHFKEGGNNRVILGTDGDFNVGITDQNALIELIESEADGGVFLTIYGFSTWSSGNYQDATMEELSNHGNGTYFFIDGEAEARRAFAHSLSGTLLTTAKDVKLQVQFNPDMVKGYRLIGYDNRTLSNDDFNNDTVDAGELGNGEDMTAFYEIIPAISEEEVPPTDTANDDNAGDDTVYESLAADEFMAVRLRYKDPDSEESALVTHPISTFHDCEISSPKFVFASAVAHLGLILRQSVYIEETRISAISNRLLDSFLDITVPAISELLTLVDLAAKAGAE
jgi:Ca-activated chloride channel family protein